MEQDTDSHINKKSSLKRELGLTGDIDVDVERFGKNGRKLSEINKRNKSVEKAENILLDIVFPACDNVTDVLMVVGLYTMPSYRTFSYWTMGLLYLPTIFLVIHYFLNLTKKRRWYVELPFLILLGPAVDWMIYLARLVKGKRNMVVDKELDKFLYIAKIVNGVIEASLQLIWTLLLISIKVRPLPWSEMTQIPDLVGNTIPVPASTLSIIFSVISIIKSLAFFWNKYGVARSDGTVSEDTRYRFLVPLILVTTMVFRLGCLVIFAVYLNIYTMAILGLSLVTFNLLRLFRTCFEDSCALGETVSGFANSILPTPSSTDQRSHNLYLLHDLVTSSIYLCFLIIIQILNLNYSQPYYKRLDNLIIGHNEFLVMIGVIITIMIVHCVFRFIFYIGNLNTSDRKPKLKKSKKLSIKVTKILIFKVIASLVLLLLMVSSLALTIVSVIVTTKHVEVKEDDISSTCDVKFETEPDNEFLTISSISCRAVSKVIFSSSQNVLNDTQCYSSVRTIDVEDRAATFRSFLEDDFQNLANNQTATIGINALPFGFGTLENIIFITMMALMLLSLVILVLFCKRPTKKMKKPAPEKIALHSTKKRIERENPTERTL